MTRPDDPAADEARRELARAYTVGKLMGGGAPDELPPICVDELPAAMGFEPYELGELGELGELRGGVVGWQHFAADGSDVWIGTLEPSFDVNPRAPLLQFLELAYLQFLWGPSLQFLTPGGSSRWWVVGLVVGEVSLLASATASDVCSGSMRPVVVQQQREGGFWTAIGGKGPEALAAVAAVAAGVAAVPLATVERLGTDARGRGPCPLALLVPGASDNGTRLHGTLVAAEHWLRAQWRADIEAGGHGDYGWTFGRDLPGGSK